MKPNYDNYYKFYRFVQSHRKEGYWQYSVDTPIELTFWEDPKGIKRQLTTVKTKDKNDTEMVLELGKMYIRNRIPGEDMELEFSNDYTRFKIWKV